MTDSSELGRRVNEGFVPIIRPISGFVDYYFIDAGGGVMISLSVFEDQAGAEESNSRAVDLVQQNVGSLIPNPPQVTDGEVVAPKAT